MNAELVTYLEIDAKKKFNLVETFSDVTSLSLRCQRCQINICLQPIAFPPCSQRFFLDWLRKGKDWGKVGWDLKELPKLKVGNQGIRFVKINVEWFCERAAQDLI